MAASRSGADRRRRSASDPVIGRVRGFFKLFSAWVFQALCSEFPLEVQERLGFNPSDRTPAWRRFLERLPKSKEDAAIGLSADLDSVLSLISSGQRNEFHWLAPWADLFVAIPEARALLSFTGLELAEAFRKVKEPCSEAFVGKAVDQYHKDELTLVPDLTASYPGALWPQSPSPAIQVGRVMVNFWLHGLHPSFSYGCFGPGAVAEKLDHIDRATSLPSWRPVYHTMTEPSNFASREEWRTWMLTHDWCEPSGLFPQACESRMVAVPKTSTKPRLIAAEPTANSWRQQSLLHLLKDRMGKFPYLDITDQVHNQDLCMRGLATIDQSRASDRVADILVRALFPPEWVDAFERVRTPSVQCLCGETHSLSKFAGMGAATTFPVETLIFAACAFSRGYLEDGGTPWDDRHSIEDWLVKQASTDTWGFYGDDAVVPNRLYDAVCDEYQRWGFIPNLAKSYHGTDQFRESCGVMATLSPNGCWEEVSPARFSSWPGASTRVAQSASTVEVLNRIRLKIFLLTGVEVDCDESAWTKIPRRKMLWDYSDMKSLLWNPKGFGWWDGELTPMTPAEYQQNWSQVGGHLAQGVVYRTKCEQDGEIPPSALHVCLSRITGPAHVAVQDSFDQDSGEHQSVRQWVIPTAPSVLREPRPKKVVAVIGHRV